MNHSAPILGVLPVLFDNEHERTFFANHLGLLTGLVQNILSVPRLSWLLVVTEDGIDPPLPDSGRLRRLHLPMADRPRTGNHPFDCPGLAAALADSEQDDFGHVVCLDIRQPFLSGADLASALDLYAQEAPPVLLSVRPANDHPCQYRRYARTEEQGLIHLFEAADATVPEAPPGLPHRIGRAVPVDWSELPAVDRKQIGSLWAPDRTGNETGMRLVAPRRAAEEPVLWLVAAATRARVLVHPRMLPAAPQELAGIIHGDLFRQGRVRPVLGRPDGGLDIDFGAEAEEALILLATADSTGKAGEATRLLTGQGQRRVVYMPGAACPHGLLFTRMRLVKEGPYDLSYPFWPKGVPWAWDRAGGLVNDATGKGMYGRQDFPLALIREPGVALFRRDLPLDAFPAVVAEGQALGWSIAHPGLDIRSARDAALAACIARGLAKETGGSLQRAGVPFQPSARGGGEPSAHGQGNVAQPLRSHGE